MGMFNLTPKKIDAIKQSARGVLPSFLGGVGITKAVKPLVTSRIGGAGKMVAPMKPKFQPMEKMKPMKQMPMSKKMPR